MTNFEWFLLIVVVIGVPLIVAVVVTLWTIDQARKRKRQNRPDAAVGVKRKATREPQPATPVEGSTTPVSPEDVSRETSVPDAGPTRTRAL
jgi:hypothetical protein